MAGAARDTTKKVPAVPYRATDLGARMEGAAVAGGGIQPGAHPEFEKETPLDKVITAVKRLLRPKPIGNSSVDAHNRRAYEFEKSQR